MKIEFSTRPYLLSHGREPSRVVVGSWAFEFEDSRDPWFAPGSLTLAKAKAAAREEARRRAGPGGIATVIKVLP